MLRTSSRSRESYSVTFKYDGGLESYPVFKGMPVIATCNLKDMAIFNTMEFSMEAISDIEAIIRTVDGENRFSYEEFGKSFIPSYCATLYKYQGATISEEYNIFDCHLMDKKQIYTALSRCTEIANVRLDNAQLLSRYTRRRQPDLKLTGAHESGQQTGKIYEIRFEASDKIYIGSTCEELVTRLQWHLMHQQEDPG